MGKVKRVSSGLYGVCASLVRVLRGIHDVFASRGEGPHCVASPSASRAWCIGCIDTQLDDVEL